MNAPTETPQQAARRLAGGVARDGYAPQALHTYTDADGAPLYWRIRCKRPGGEKWVRPMRLNGAGYELGEPEFPAGKPIYRLHEIAVRPNDPVYVVEGELCADALASLGLIATTSGGADSAPKAAWGPLRGRAVTVWPDHDPAGEKYAQGVSEALERIGCTVRVIDAAALDLPPKGDCVDWLAAHPNATAADVLALPVREPEPSPMVTRCLADVKPEPVRWLWPGRIARGKVTVLAGHPGLGKSQICASLAAVVTTGGLWPVDRTRAEAGAVAILSAEDDAADTILPRLLAAGADIRRVHALDAVRCLDGAGNPAGRMFSLSRDCAALAATLETLGDIALLVVDPISAYLGGIDSHRNAEVRALLAPLSDLAARLGVAVVAVSHLNKGGGTDALARVTGSLAFTAAARAAWIVAKDAQNPARRLFVPAKNNLGADGAGLAFGIEPATVADGIDTSRVVWHAEPVTMTATEALAAEIGPDRREEAPQRDEATAWLRAALEDGAVASDDLLAAARRDGIARRTLFRAKAALCVRARKSGFAGGWVWEMPAEECRPTSPTVPSTETLAPFDESEPASAYLARVPPKSATIPGVGSLGDLGNDGDTPPDAYSAPETCPHCLDEGCAWCRPGMRNEAPLHRTLLPTPNRGNP